MTIEQYPDQLTGNAISLGQIVYIEYEEGAFEMRFYGGAQLQGSSAQLILIATWTYENDAQYKEGLSRLRRITSAQALVVNNLPTP